jgi:hypothetical protein
MWQHMKLKHALDAAQEMNLKPSGQRGRPPKHQHHHLVASELLKKPDMMDPTQDAYF